MSPDTASTSPDLVWPKGSQHFLVAFLLFVVAGAAAFQVAHGGFDPGVLMYAAIYAAPALAMYRGWPIARPFFVALNFGTALVFVAINAVNRFDPVSIAVAVPLVAFSAAVVFPKAYRPFFEPRHARQT